MRVYTGLNQPLTINGLDNVTPNGDNDYSVIKYEYDFYGNKISYTDAVGNEQVFNYNQFNGRLLSRRDGRDGAFCPIVEIIAKWYNLLRPYRPLDCYAKSGFTGY